MPTIPYGRRSTDPASPTFEAVAMISLDGKGYTVPLAVASKLMALERERADNDEMLRSAQRHAIECGSDLITRNAELMTAQEALRAVLREWVNGRLVAEGISLTVRQRAEAALQPPSQRTAEDVISSKTISSTPIPEGLAEWERHWASIETKE